MQEIARIVRVQVQRSPMKSSEGDTRAYNPAPLLEVPSLMLTADGVTGIAADGQQHIDAHNARHPATRNTGSNGISFGFVHNYTAMRDRFGIHLQDGIAGENILLVLPQDTLLPDFTSGSYAFCSAADGTLIELVSVVPAPPCEPFSRFCAQDRPSAPEMKSILQFLNDGRRGYYAELADRESRYYVEPGDTLVRL